MPAAVKKKYRTTIHRVRRGFSGRADLGAGVLILLLTAVSQWWLVTGGTVVGMDTATQFYPWYSYLGESLRSGTLPAWNPAQLSGAPFAADPLSGWTYLPAMVLFTLLPLTFAAKAYIFLHPLLAGLFTYALGRKLGLGVPGALVAAVAYEHTGFLYVQNTCCSAYASVATWLPLTLLGAELAVRSTRWLSRGLWWGVSGLGVSQILASWLGQGSYYALLALGSYIAYRTLFFPPKELPDTHRLWKRPFFAALHGGGPLLFGFGLAAAGLLPRLEYNPLTTLAGGYPGEKAELIGGWTIRDWQSLFTAPGLFYAGGAVVALALVAPFVSGRLMAVPYFAGLAVFALTFSGQGITLLHQFLYLLPRFEKLHPHNPERLLVLFYLAAALLAGATVTRLIRRERGRFSLAALPLVAALFLATRSTLVPPIEPPDNLTPEAIASGRFGPWEAPSLYLLEKGVSMPPGVLAALFAAAVLAAVCALLPGRYRAWSGLTAILVALVIFVDLFAAGRAALMSNLDTEGGGAIRKVDLSEYYAPSGAVEFLRSEAAGGEPSRYFGYYPRTTESGTTVPYSIRFDEPDTTALLVNNRATLYGLQSLQGYNPTHLAAYDEYLRALNDRSQNYHDADIFARGLDSPLLDLLNARYILVPTGVEWKSIEELKREYPTVYKDEQVTLLENRDALPRAWVVHDARQTQPDKALEQLSSGEVDPRRTALLEEKLPELPGAPETSGEARVTSYQPEKIEVEAQSGEPGLLMLSEIYHPAWKAYVDGEPVPVYRADYTLRAVPVPAGEHTVELRYESRALTAGLVTSLLTTAALVALVAARMVTTRRRNAPSASEYKEGVR